MWAQTDFAGCARTRKSTSGGVVQFGNHFVKSSSSTQGLGAMSSGKADCYGIVKGASMGLGIKIVLSVLGVAVNAIIRMDASATKGIANRKGLGKVRHIQLNQLWIQDRVVKGEIIVLKVKGKEKRKSAYKALQCSGHYVPHGQDQSGSCMRETCAGTKLTDAMALLAAILKAGK